MEIHNLKDKLEFIEEVAFLEREEWGSNSSKTLEEKVEKIKKNFNNEYFEKIILVDGKELIGFISMFEYDMEERRDLKPWYATMYVKKEYRGKRILKDTQ
ncbi:MAG: GNAT family N-acetyltransferase [Clostridia bacterium]|nr:GNAT family N-acetyltransferase [Clostridia bacterium]